MLDIQIGDICIVEIFGRQHVSLLVNIIVADNVAKLFWFKNHNFFIETYDNNTSFRSQVFNDSMIII